MIEFLKGNETFDNWTELGTTYIFRLKMNIAIKDKMDELYQRIKSNCPSAQMKIIEKDDKAKCPWYIYKIECSSTAIVSESQVWYAVQTKNEQYVSFISIKQKTIPANFQDKWVKIFKSAKIISQ